LLVRHPGISIFLLPLLLVGLPLAGVMMQGESLAPYLEFPPRTYYVQHAPFSWYAFILIALMPVSALVPLILRFLRYSGSGPAAPLYKYPFPWWGYAGIMLTAFAWFFAWTRFQWFEPFQAYTFFPLWLGFIVAVNSLAYIRTGRCLLLDNTRFFLALFPLSSLFWWFFEYLNRFVQNWHYLGIENFSAGEYILHASLCFSTVLPAVQSMEEYLASFPRISRPLENWQPVSVDKPGPSGWFLLAIAIPSLAGISVYPDYLFPMLWIAPFLIITAIQAIRREDTVFRGLKEGDWRGVWLPALAALICGLFWEMWNYKSMAHWEYSVPFVDRFHLFAMPILGFAGYLPFGLECMAVSMMLHRSLGAEVYR
jgi:hypothetical protein